MKEKMNRLEIKSQLYEAFKQNKAKSIIYELFSKYEDEWEKIKRPTPQEQDEFIELHREYIRYMKRNKEID
jgi:hypothetical protein